MRGGGFDLPHHEELAISTKNLTFAIILFSTFFQIGLGLRLTSYIHSTSLHRKNVSIAVDTVSDIPSVAIAAIAIVPAPNT